MSELLKFVLFAPYRTDAVELRTSVNSEHRQRILKLREEGFIGLGGPLSDPVDHHLTGSLVVFHTKTFKEAEDLVKADVYYTAGVWDLEKLSLLRLGAGIPGPS